MKYDTILYLISQVYILKYFIRNLTHRLTLYIIKVLILLPVHVAEKEFNKLNSKAGSDI